MCRKGLDSGYESCAIDAAMKMTEENSSGESEITMDDVKNLIKKKDDIEEQIKAYYEVLDDVSVLDIQFHINVTQS